MQKLKETSPKNPMRMLRTRNEVKIEREFQEKDKKFTSYERKSRKHKQVQKGQITKDVNELEHAHDAYIQTLEEQEK